MKEFSDKMLENLVSSMAIYCPDISYLLTLKQMGNISQNVFFSNIVPNLL